MSGLYGYRSLRANPIPYDVRSGIIGRGADRAVVSFSGGNDEGGADMIRLFKGDELVAELEPVHDFDDDEIYDPEKKEWVPNPNPTDPDKLAVWLTGLPDGRYGGWGGEGYIRGKVTVDTTTGKVAWDVDEQRWTSSSWED